MKRLSLSPGLLGSLVLLSLLFVSFSSAPQSPKSEGELEGAWRMVQNRGQAMSDLNLDMVKILVDGHFMFAFFSKDQQSFYSCGGGEYSYNDGIYTESILFHTIDPDLVGRSLPFDAKVADGKWYHTGAINDGEMNEVFERIEGEEAAQLMGAWHVYARGGSETDLREVKAKRVQTWKLIAGDRYSWATFSPKKGDLLSCGGGVVHIEDDWCREEIEYDSVDSTMVGKVLAYQGLPNSEEWLVKPPSTRGSTSDEVIQWKKMTD